MYNSNKKPATPQKVRTKKNNYIFFQWSSPHPAGPEEVSSPAFCGAEYLRLKKFFWRERNKFRSSPPLCFVETGNRWFPNFAHNAGR